MPNCQDAGHQNHVADLLALPQFFSKLLLVASALLIPDEKVFLRERQSTLPFFPSTILCKLDEATRVR